MEEQLVVGERRMDGRQEEDDVQMGLEAAGVENDQKDEIVQEGLAPELARAHQEEQERQRIRRRRGAGRAQRVRGGHGSCDHSRGRCGGRDHGCGVHNHGCGIRGHGRGGRGHHCGVRGHEPAGKQSWVCPKRV